MPWSEMWNTCKKFQNRLSFDWVTVKIPPNCPIIAITYLLTKLLQNLTITRPKLNRFWKFLHAFHILDQGTAFLFYEFFTLYSAKITFLTITQKGLDGFFFFLHILKAWETCLQKPCIIIFGLFFSTNVPSS